MKALSSPFKKWFILLFILPVSSFSQGLDLGTEDAKNIVSHESLFPYANLTLILFAVFLILGSIILAFIFLNKNKKWEPPVILENFPLTAKAAITLTFISYSLVHVFALLEVYLVTKVSFKSTSEYFFYMNLPKLLATSHAHFFGHGTMYFVTSIVFIFSKLKDPWKLLFITLALSAGLLDVASWWAIKYGGSQYELFSAIAGFMSVVGFGTMAMRTVYELWWYEIFGRKT